MSSAYSVVLKRESAHEDPIYCCVWTRVNLVDDLEVAPRDVIATAGSLAEIKVWEWYWERNQLVYRRTMKDHILAITSLAISPDGQTLVSTAMDFTIIVWDMVTGERIHKIPAPKVWRAEFAPDGVHIVTGCHSGDLVIYNVVKGSVESVIGNREQFAIAVAWSANDKYIASGSTTGSVCVMESVHFKVVHTFRDHSESVKELAFSPNSKLLASSSTDGCFNLYDVVAGALLHSLRRPSWALCVSFSPEGARLACCTADGELLILATDGLRVLKQFKEHDDAVWQARFSPKGDLVVSVSKDKSINMYECPPLIKATK